MNIVKQSDAALQEILEKLDVSGDYARRVHGAIETHGVPHNFTFKGIPLTHPYGRPKDLVTGIRLERLNAALVANVNKPIPARLADVQTCTRAYTALWNKSRRDDYDPTPVPGSPGERLSPTDAKLARLEREVRKLHDA